MSRPLRIEFPDAWYHVMNRGRRRERIFPFDRDYQDFVDLLRESSELWRVHVAAYCLMANHYHLLVQTPEGNLSRFMRHVNGLYTQRYNRKHRCDGPLFRGRYQAILVEGDRYLLGLVRYIHRNPIQAGLVKTLSDYAWSSHPGYISGARKWNWLYKDFVLDLFSIKARERRRLYQRFMGQEDSADVTRFFDRKRLPPVWGGEDFVRWVKSEYYEEKTDRQVPESGCLVPELAEIRRVVCEIYQVEPSELLKSRRGVFNEPRSVAIYLARLLRRDSLLDISRAFSMKGYSSASSAVAGLKRRLADDRGLRQRVERAGRMITKGQTET